MITKKLFSLFLSIATTASITTFRSRAEQPPVSKPYNNISVSDVLHHIDKSGNLIVGEFYQDGALSIAWTRQSIGKTYVYHTLIPSTLVETIPTNESGQTDLLYAVDNVLSFNTDISLISVVDNTEPPSSYDMLKDNAIRKCLSEACDITEYNSNIIATSSSGSTQVQVYETKTVEIYKTSVNYVKAGWDFTSTVASIVAATTLPYADVADYVSTAMGFVDGLIPEDTTVEEYAGDVRYFRTSAYQGPNDSSYKFCPTVNEEKAVLYTIMINYAIATSDTTDYMDVTSIVGDPEVSYLNTKEAFAETHIINRTYEYSRSH